jgi:hypothetical protein
MTPEARAARERKQKIFVVAGGLVLLLLMAIQLPKLMGGSGSSAASTTQETTAPGDVTTPGAPTPPGTTPGTKPGAVPVALVDTDRPLPLEPGQLRSFSGFKMKDPFVQQVVQPEPEPVRATTPKRAKKKTQAPSKDFSAAKKATAPGVTVVAVNGVRHALEPGGKFPAASPVFVLVSVKPAAKTAVVGVLGGKYANGSRTTTLEVGKPLVLVNTKTKSRYRVVLVRVPAPKSS